MLATAPHPPARRSRDAQSEAHLRRRHPSAPSAAGPADRAIDAAVALAKAGDREAMAFLYERYADGIYRYVRSILRDEHDAEDVTQLVFTRLISEISRYEPRGVPISAWLLRVARNLSVDRIRDRRIVPVEQVRDETDECDDGAHYRQEALIEAFKALTAVQRQVLLLRHVRGLSLGEIAQRLNSSDGAVYGIHYRGRTAMQVTLRQLGSAPLTKL